MCMPAPWRPSVGFCGLVTREISDPVKGVQRGVLQLRRRKTASALPTSAMNNNVREDNQNFMNVLLFSSSCRCSSYHFPEQ